MQVRGVTSMSSKPTLREQGGVKRELLLFPLRTYRLLEISR